MKNSQRNDLVFKLYYSYNLERLSYCFNTRLNILFTLLQSLLACTIIGDFSRYSANFNIAIGFILAVLSALSFVYRFGEKAGASKIAMNRYSALIHRYSTMSDDEMSDALLESSSIDSPITGSLVEIAYKRSAIQLELQDDTKLNCYQKFIAKFCGEKF